MWISISDLNAVADHRTDGKSADSEDKIEKLDGMAKPLNQQENWTDCWSKTESKMTILQSWTTR